MKKRPSKCGAQESSDVEEAPKKGVDLVSAHIIRPQQTWT